jgi:hypothetical protein
MRVSLQQCFPAMSCGWQPAAAGWQGALTTAAAASLALASNSNSVMLRQSAASAASLKPFPFFPPLPTHLHSAFLFPPLTPSAVSHARNPAVATSPRERRAVKVSRRLLIASRRARAQLALGGGLAAGSSGCALASARRAPRPCWQPRQLPYRPPSAQAAAAAVHAAAKGPAWLLPPLPAAKLVSGRLARDCPAPRQPIVAARAQPRPCLGRRLRRRRAGQRPRARCHGVPPAWPHRPQGGGRGWQLRGNAHGRSVPLLPFAGRKAKPGP